MLLPVANATMRVDPRRVIHLPDSELCQTVEVFIRYYVHHNLMIKVLPGSGYLPQLHPSASSIHCGDQRMCTQVQPTSIVLGSFPKWIIHYICLLRSNFIAPVYERPRAKVGQLKIGYGNLSVLHKNALKCIATLLSKYHLISS